MYKNGTDDEEDDDCDGGDIRADAFPLHPETNFTDGIALLLPLQHPLS